MIKLKNINKTYITKTGIQTNALKNINLEFPEKGLFFIIGKTGCGKSTLLNMIGKLDEPSSGEILIGNTNLTKLSPKENDDYRNHFVGFVFQNYNLIEELTVYENIALVQKLQGKKPNKEEIDILLEKLNLAKHKEKLCDEISGGQRQRVSIARALIKNPKMILADEPTGAIDSKTGREILNILKDISKEKLVIIVSHNIDFANNYADYIIKMADGKIIENSYQVKETPNNYVLNNTRGNIDFKECFKLGFFNLHFRITRLIMMLLILITAFVGFGITSTFIQFDQSRILVESMEKNNVQYLNLGPDFERFSTIEFEEIEKIQKKYSSKKFYPVYGMFSDGLEVCYDYYKHHDDSNGNFFDGHIFGQMTINSQIAQDLGLKLVAGEYPKNANEIVISTYNYEVFKRYGLENIGVLDSNARNTYYEINSYDDIIGKEIILNYSMIKSDLFVIVGIIDTGFNFNKYLEQEEKKVRNNYSVFITDLYSNIASYTFHNEEYLEHCVQKDVKIKYYGVCTSFKTKSEKKIIKNFYNENLKPKNLYSIKIDDAGKTLKKVSKMLYILTIILIILSSLIMYIYTRNIIDDKRKQIGIMRTLGATKKDIAKIFLVEMFIISFIVSLISIIASAIITNMFNQYLINDIGIILKILSFNFTTVFLIIIVSFCISFISVLIPISSICRLNPIESLKS